jgi:translation initiation factor 3 subunit I
MIDFKETSDYKDVRAFALYGHTRPVKKIRFNRDGDMFFTCGDDKLMNAWDLDGNRIGVYYGTGACKSFAISYNTEFIVGAFSTEGVEVFDALTGKSVRKIVFPSLRCINVDFNYGDTEIAVTLMGQAKSFVNTYDFKTFLSSKGMPIPKCSIEFREDIPSQATYGYLNEHLYVSTYNKKNSHGNLYKFDVTGAEGVEVHKHVKLHTGEIFSFAFSKDFTMLATCSDDCKCLVLDPISLEIY